MENKKLVITISRQHGAGGRSAGRQLAAALGISYYDDEILKITSEVSAVGEQYFRLADERAGSNLLYKIFDSVKPELTEPDISGNITSSDNLFRFQAKMIRELAGREDCVIIGRAADYVLKDTDCRLLRVYVYADMERKVARVMNYDSCNRENAEKNVRKTDKKRTDFYRYYTGQNWGDPENYDLCINSGSLEVDEIAKIIKHYVEMKGLLIQ